MTKNITKAQQKQLVADFAIDTLIKNGAIFNGMKIGLGTGSTAVLAVKRLSEYIKLGKLKDIKAVTTSFQTQSLCEDLDIATFCFDSKLIAGSLDLVIDGADEIDPYNNLIKGGGAALLREKIAAYNSKHYAIIADKSKLVKTLGTKFPVPVEVVSCGAKVVALAITKLGATCEIRQGIKKCGPVITDNGNMILDCLWQRPIEPAIIEDKIKGITGVIEVGLFCKTKPTVFVADENEMTFVFECKR